MEASSRGVRVPHEWEHQHNAPLRRHKYAPGTRAIKGETSGAPLTQPDGGGQKIQPRRLYERWQEPGCRLEKTSELCTFLSCLAAGGGWCGGGGNQETLELFPAEKGSWSATLGKPLTVTRCLESSSARDNRSLVCCGCGSRQCVEPGWLHVPSLRLHRAGSSLSPGPERRAGPGYQLTATCQPAHRMFLRHPESRRWKIL